MKQWPNDRTKSVSFHDLVKPVKDALLFAYDIKRKNEDKDIPYNGYDTGKSVQICDFSPIEKLKAENLEYEKSEQDRDALSILLGIAIQLGIEQGERSFKASPVYQLMKLRLDMIKSVANKKEQKP